MEQPTKILLVVPRNSSFKKPIQQSLNKLRVESGSFDNRKTTYYEKLLFASSKIFPKIYTYATSLINKRLLGETIKFKPDIVLVIKGENLKNEYIKKIAARAVIVNWFPDYLVRFNKMKGWLKNYTTFLSADRYEVSRFRKLGFKNLYYLPFAGPILPASKKQRKYNVVFFGSYTKERELLFSDLKKLNFKIWGNKAWAQSSLKDNFAGQWLPYEEMLNTLKESKIVVNHHRESGPKNTVLNLRVYEACACGSLLITDERGDASKLFNINQEVVTYKDKRDLYKKVKYYLLNENIRQKIALAGYKRLNKEHTYKHRIEQIFKICALAKSLEA